MKSNFDANYMFFGKSSFRMELLNRNGKLLENRKNNEILFIKKSNFRNPIFHHYTPLIPRKIPITAHKLWFLPMTTSIFIKRLIVAVQKYSLERLFQI
jgi:hypothetical protein